MEPDKGLDKRDIITVILAEYTALRGEIICCLTSQYQVWTFGIPVIGAAFTAALSWWTKEISILLFSALIPLLVIICMLFWGNQVARMNRAGAYISDFIESKLEILAGEDYRKFLPSLEGLESESRLPPLPSELKEQFGGDKRVESIEEAFRSILGWETWLRSKGLQQFYKSFEPWKYYLYTQKSIVWIGFLFYWASVGLGATQIGLYLNWCLYTRIGILVGLVIVWLLVFRIVALRLRNVAVHKRLDPAAEYIQRGYKRVFTGHRHEH